MSNMERQNVATSPLYADSGKVSFASALSWRARVAVYERFLSALVPQHQDTILDVGVTCDRRFHESNFLERLYPHKDRITCVGTEDASHLEHDYPGLRFTRVDGHEPLPFGANHFKIAFSNAVIEHVGSCDQQRSFLREMLRVSERFFVATPNRWFPIEVHTGLPLLHYAPAPLFRRLLARTRYRFWADERNLNLLSGRDLRGLFPTSTEPTLDVVGIGWGAARSNLVAYGRSGGHRR